MSIAAVASPLCPLMTCPCPRGELADEALCGMSLEILECQGPWRRVRTPYRYEGWAPVDCLTLGPRAEVWESLPQRMVLGKNSCDVLAQPKYQSRRLLSLPLGASVAPAGPSQDGWQRVALADGCEGFVRSSWLGVPPKALSENALRQGLVDTAKRYLGAPYRWGGKTPLGIDCSGLTSMAYLLNGVTIWRDAALKEGFPIRPISREEMEPGDLLYFPGHVAMYLGLGEYIHATGREGSDGVCINSLDPAHPHYRADLAESLHAVGSYF